MVVNNTNCVVLLPTKMIGTLEVFEYIFIPRYFCTIFQSTNHPNIEHADSVCGYDKFRIIKFRVLTKEVKVRFFKRYYDIAVDRDLLR